MVLYYSWLTAEILLFYLRKRLPDGTSTKCGGEHLIAADYSFIECCSVAWPLNRNYFKLTQVQFETTQLKRSDFKIFSTVPTFR